MGLGWDEWVVALAALASAVVGGAFFAFSAFVMPGLRLVSPREGIAAMQGINRVAPRSLLLVPLLASPAGGAVVAAHALLGDASQPAVRVAGGLLAVAGFAVTPALNVPLNDELDRTDASAEDAPARWAAYLGPWVRWNHLRTVLCLGAAVLLAAGLRG
jgi:uncharacterized membrane protein